MIDPNERTQAARGLIVFELEKSFYTNISIHSQTFKGIKVETRRQLERLVKKGFMEKIGDTYICSNTKSEACRRILIMARNEEEISLWGELLPSNFRLEY